ncbi:uncharacterized protein LOC122519108 [Polistes fuscatus]|uniref:uncharacterized protein LOC122519108 n=1 Tax=Polistes fuscatus TaxID=30207 RepID=UPI001CA8194E|nr:uncharacterized protein LOC122519108 [Polistes fuscatus]
MITNEEKNTKENFSYFFEIMPDYQKRRKLNIKNVQSVPNESATHVDTNLINAKSLMSRYFVEFASNSSINGLKHLVARNRHMFERILLTIIILAALASLTYISIISWYRYEYGAISVYSSHQYKLFRLLKPSILMCPINLIQVSSFSTTFKRYGIEDTPNARAFFHFLSNATYKTMINTPDYDDAPPELWLRILSDLKKEFTYETNLTGKGIWVATENGLCVSVGNFVLHYASLQNLLSNNWTVIPLPNHPPDSENFEKSDENIDNFNYLPSYTYDKDHGKKELVKTDTPIMLSILNPMDSYSTTRGNLLQTLEYQISTLRIIQGDSMKSIYKIPIRRRHCGFPFDKGLELWPIYTYFMCMTECRARIIRTECGCYPHFLRRIHDVPICNTAQLRCIGKIQRSGLLNVKPLSCDCPYNCNTVVYLMEDIKLTKWKEVTPINTTSLTMTVDFSKNKYKRREWYTFGDLLTSIGGAAGLFLGCSVISFCEILYYGTLHLYIYIRKHKKNQKSS